LTARWLATPENIIDVTNGIAYVDDAITVGVSCGSGFGLRAGPKDIVNDQNRVANAYDTVAISISAHLAAGNDVENV